jgi:hypothetical protein
MAKRRTYRQSLAKKDKEDRKKVDEIDRLNARRITQAQFEILNCLGSQRRHP